MLIFVNGHHGDETSKNGASLSLLDALGRRGGLLVLVPKSRQKSAGSGEQDAVSR